MDWEDIREEIVGWLFVLGVLGLVGLGVYETFIDDSYSAPTQSETRHRTYVQQDEPSAVCNDGSYSYSSNDQGTCSWHGGVDYWLD